MVKDGDTVYFKTRDHRILSGVLVKGTVFGKGGTKYKPPKRSLFKTQQDARKSDWNPYPVGSQKDLLRKVEIARSRLPQFTPAQIQEQVVAGNRRFNPVASDIGRSNLEALLRLGDVSERIQQAVKEREAAVKIQSVARGDINRRRMTYHGWRELIDPIDDEDIGDDAVRHDDWVERARDELEEGTSAEFLRYPWRFDLGARPHYRRGYNEAVTDPIGGSEWREAQYDGVPTGPKLRNDLDAVSHGMRRLGWQQDWGDYDTRGWVRAHKPTIRRLLDRQEERRMMAAMLREPDDY